MYVCTYLYIHTYIYIGVHRKYRRRSRAPSSPRLVGAGAGLGLDGRAHGEAEGLRHEALLEAFGQLLKWAAVVKEPKLSCHIL